jgi:hypothetical protein
MSTENAGASISTPARRKVEMADYHFRQLRGEMLGFNRQPRGPEPPVAVQAHFEGALYCAVAAADQSGEAIRTAMGLWIIVAQWPSCRAQPQGRQGPACPGS